MLYQQLIERLAGQSTRLTSSSGVKETTSQFTISNKIHFDCNSDLPSNYVFDTFRTEKKVLSFARQEQLINFVDPISHKESTRDQGTLPIAPDEMPWNPRSASSALLLEISVFVLLMEVKEGLLERREQTWTISPAREDSDYAYYASSIKIMTDHHTKIWYGLQDSDQ